MAIWNRWRWASAGALVIGLALAVAGPGAGWAQPVAARVGILFLASPESDNSRRAVAFREGLQELGYVEGQNVVFEYRYADGKPERLPGLAAKLVRGRVDVIVAVGFQAAIAAKAATKSIPIVMAPAGDPISQGLVTNLARPEGNVTGVALMSPEVRGKRLSLLKEMVPKLTRVAIVVNPARRSSVTELESVAARLGVQIEWVEITGSGMLDALRRRLRAAQVHGIYAVESPLLDGIAPRIAEIAREQRLPSVFPFKEAVEGGGLMSYATSFAETQRRAASYVHRILTGARPGDLPIEQADRFELVVNLRTARAIGLTVPASILVQAHQVIE
jgi:putative ABC transport system substrate-binding protein